jgi:hypothetical protein
MPPYDTKPILRKLIDCSRSFQSRAKFALVKGRDDPAGPTGAPAFPADSPTRLYVYYPRSGETLGEER